MQKEAELRSKNFGENCVCSHKLQGPAMTAQIHAAQSTTQQTEKT